MTDLNEQHVPQPAIANDEFRPLAVDYPVGFKGTVRSRRVSVSAEADRKENLNYVKKMIPKSDEAMERIRKACSKCLLFTGLDQSQAQDIYDAMEEVKVSAGEEVIRQYDNGDYFYVIDSGQFDVYKKDGPKNAPGEAKKVFEYEDGSFGELALMYNCPRAATVKARTDGALWRVDRETFRHIIIDTTARKRKIFEEFLEQVPILSNLSRQERAQVADCLETVEFQKDDVIIKQGDDGDKIFFILSGSASATQAAAGSEEQIEVGRMNEGHYFGERALITRQPRAANVIALGPMRCAAMDRSAFERLLGPIKDIMERQIQQYRTADQIASGTTPETDDTKTNSTTDSTTDTTATTETTTTTPSS